MLPVFKDNKLQVQFEEDGYVKLSLFSKQQITRLREFYVPLQQKHEAAIREQSLYSSVETGDANLLRQVDREVKAVVMEQVEKVFQNYQTLISNYLIKANGDQSELFPHQDLTFVDEPEQCSFNLWIPLQKTDKHSGQLRVLKGSHCIQSTLRVVPSYPWPFQNFSSTLRGLLTPIDTEPGDCVVLNHSVIHGSSTNLTGQPRVAVILGMCSAPAPLYYYYLPNGDSTRIEKYLMTAEDYYHFMPDGRPVHAKLIDTISYTFKPTEEKVLKKWIKHDSHLNLMQKVKLLYLQSLSTK